MVRPALVLDCDPGVDDVFAVFAAARYGELLAITTVNGNVGVDKTTRNALLVTQVAGIEVPVHRGAAAPLLAPVRGASDVHGESGLGRVALPPLERSPAGLDAVGYLLDITRQRHDVHLVAVGPLTNVALAVRCDPGFVHRLSSLTIMGGAVGAGNVTATAEFNIWSDPEAAAIVYESGVPVHTITLETTHQVRAGRTEAAALRASGTRSSHLAADLLDHYGGAVVQGAAAIHDPCAVLAVTHPELFGFVDRRLDVELTGTHTRGMTVVDLRTLPNPRPGNARVAATVDAGAVLALILDASIAPR